MGDLSISRSGILTTENQVVPIPLNFAGFKGHILNKDKPKEVAKIDWRVCGKISFDPQRPKGQRATLVDLDENCRTA